MIFNTVLSKLVVYYTTHEQHGVIVYAMLNFILDYAVFTIAKEGSRRGHLKPIIETV